MNTNIKDQGVQFIANRSARERVGARGSKAGSNANARAKAGANANAGTNTLIEGFDNGSVNEVNAREYNELRNLETEMQRELQKYTTLKKQLMDNTRGYLEASRGGNPNLNQNVKIGSKSGYITRKGIFKEYASADIGNNTAGKHSCPANWESAQQINNHFTADFANQMFETIPGTNPIINGTPMKAGQSCGNEGSNVFVSKITPNTKSYVGIYKSVAGSDMQIQTDLGQTSVDQCQSRAALRNADYFAMSDFDGTNSSCYIGNDKTQIQASGTPTIDHVIKNVSPANPTPSESGSAPHLLMGRDGMLHAYSDQVPYWSSSNAPINGCNAISGGSIYVGPNSSASATYGQNCSDWNVKPNREATGLGGIDPLPGSFLHVQKNGNKAV